MDPDEEKVAAEAVEGAAKGGLLAAAASITSGLAMASTPVQLLGFITLGTTTAVSWPLVVAAGAAGAIVGGVSAAMIESNRQERVRREFTRLTKKP
ncbi:MAG: hypothetical protein KBF76_11330 [Verrucomicrobiales bacterium]|nr:hypothetical protein [Verrucomicrobiales bacterium]